MVQENAMQLSILFGRITTFTVVIATVTHKEIHQDCISLICDEIINDGLL